MNQSVAWEASIPVRLNDVACESQLRLIVTSPVRDGTHQESVSAHATQSR